MLSPLNLPVNRPLRWVDITFHSAFLWSYLQLSFFLVNLSSTHHSVILFFQGKFVSPWKETEFYNYLRISSGVKSCPVPEIFLGNYQFCIILLIFNLMPYRLLKVLVKVRLNSGKLRYSTIFAFHDTTLFKQFITSILRTTDWSSYSAPTNGSFDYFYHQLMFLSGFCHVNIDSLYKILLFRIHTEISRPTRYCLL